jgi:hypothetical protein
MVMIGLIVGEKPSFFSPAVAHMNVVVKRSVLPLMTTMFEDVVMPVLYLMMMMTMIHRHY